MYFCLSVTQIHMLSKALPTNLMLFGDGMLGKYLGCESRALKLMTDIHGRKHTGGSFD